MSFLAVWDIIKINFKTILMRKKCTSQLLLLFVLLFISSFTMGQSSRGPIVVSPEIHSDGKITFRYQAPSAKEVKLSAQFEKGPVTMLKDTNGTWSVTLGPINPDIYPYNF